MKKETLEAAVGIIAIAGTYCAVEIAIPTLVLYFAAHFTRLNLSMVECAAIVLIVKVLWPSREVKINCGRVDINGEKMEIKEKKP